MSRSTAAFPNPSARSLKHLLLLICLTVAASAQTKPRARDLGVPFDGTPGPNNAITDVKGVEVGHTPHLRRRQTRSRHRPRPHRSHRHPSPGQGQQ